MKSLPLTFAIAPMIGLLFGLSACSPGGVETASQPALVGAWRSQVDIQSGSFVGIEDFELMEVFNAGGTMTESSNYDAAPPTPPAYGIWREVGPRRYEARYEFFAMRIPAPDEVDAASGGWFPNGHGVLTEQIELSDDGNSFTSSIEYTLFDQDGSELEGGGSAEGHGTRMVFPPMARQ